MASNNNMNNMCLKFLFLTAYLVAFSSCGLRGGGLNGHRAGGFALYSTKSSGEGFRFLVVPDLSVPKSATSYEASKLKSWPEVLQSFDGLSKKTPLVWRDAPEKGWTYPETSERRSFVTDASNRSVEITVLPGLLHSN